MSSKNKQTIASVLTALTLIPNIAPEATSILNELKNAISNENVSENELDLFQKSIEQFSKINIQGRKSDNKDTTLADDYRDTYYQDRYSDTSYDDHYKDNVSYRDGTAN